MFHSLWIKQKVRLEFLETLFCFSSSQVNLLRSVFMLKICSQFYLLLKFLHLKVRDFWKVFVSFDAMVVEAAFDDNSVRISDLRDSSCATFESTAHCALPVTVWKDKSSKLIRTFSWISSLTLFDRLHNVVWKRDHWWEVHCDPLQFWSIVLVRFDLVKIKRIGTN